MLETKKKIDKVFEANLGALVQQWRQKKICYFQIHKVYQGYSGQGCDDSQRSSNTMKAYLNE